MRFTLYYRGPLKANARTEEKQKIRDAFHPQICELWNHDQLKGIKGKLLDPERHPDRPPGGYNLLFGIGRHTFSCIVSKRIFVTARLKITLLRPEEPGHILVQSGDIDNRLKTLLDALTIPQHENQIPKGWKPNEDERPFHCLLEDDALVTSLSVQTERWLNADAAEKSEVILFIGVETLTSRKTWENIEFG